MGENSNCDGSKTSGVSCKVNKNEFISHSVLHHLASCLFTSQICDVLTKLELRLILLFVFCL